MSTEATPPSPAPDTTPTSAENTVPGAPTVPEAAAPLPLPPEAEELDARVAAALVMVNHGIRRLSKLAGNIRFAFLQRDESRLVTERQKLKAAFQRQEHGPAELKFGLQALLQKTERMAGSLLYRPQNAAATTPASPRPDEVVPAATPTQADATDTSAGTDTTAATGTNAAGAAPDTPAADTVATTDTSATPDSETGNARPEAVEQASTASATPDTAATASAPAAPVLPRDRSNQIRQTLRKAMMSLAPAAPLHLQIELAAAFAETEPDIMAMAARVHALHRQVLGSLKGIQWHSATHSTLSFEDGRTIDVRFGETGAEEIPEEFRQKQAPAQPARKPGQPGQRQGAPGGRPQGNRRNKGGNGRPGARPGEGRPGRGQPAQATQPAGGNAPGADGQQDANAADSRTSQPQDKGRHGQSRRPEGGHRRPRNPADGRQADAAANTGNRPPQGPRRARPDQEGRRNQEGRRGGQGERNGRGGGNFPGNSAMADKLRAALGDSFGLGRKGK